MIDSILKKKEKMMKKLMLMALVCLTLVGCGSAPDPLTVEINPVGNELKFEQTRIEVQKGQEITVILNNTATQPMMKHNVVFLNDASKVTEVGMAAMTAPDYLPDNAAIIAATPLADPGEQTKVTFIAPKTPGTYVYICTFPGHFSVMRGELIVK